MAHTAQHNIRWEQLYMHSPNVWECITWLACDTRQKENPMRLCTLGIIVYYSDIRTFIHKGYSIIFNLYVQPNRAYKSLWCSWTVNLRGNSIIYSTFNISVRFINAFNVYYPHLCPLVHSSDAIDDRQNTWNKCSIDIRCIGTVFSHTLVSQIHVRPLHN